MYRESLCPGSGKDAFKIVSYGSSGFLGDFVLCGQVKVIGSIAQTFQGLLVLGEDGGADVRDVVQEYAANCQPSEVLTRGKLCSPQFVVPWLVRPAKKTWQLARGIVLERTEGLQVIQSFIESFVKADHLGRSRPQPGAKYRLLRLEVVGNLVLAGAVSCPESVVEDLRAATSDPSRTRRLQQASPLIVGQPAQLARKHEFSDGHLEEFKVPSVTGADA